MWRGDGRVVRPDLFKRILGQYNVTFEGYGQHDSQECINTILDFMSEDLYKKEKKPYVEQTEAEGKTDEQASLEAWNKHVYRNESIILDLFHGQYKSTLVCSVCDRISITFDPFLMVSLPIPQTKWEKYDCYYIQYDQNSESYNNFRMTIDKLRDTDRVADFRNRVRDLYGMDPDSFLVTWVYDNKLINIFHNQQTCKDITDANKGVCLLFEIPKELNPKLPPITLIKKDDSNYGIDQDWVKICVHMIKDNAPLNLARFVWARKSWTLKQLHVEFFTLYRELIYRWFKDIETTGKSDRSRYDPKYKHPQTGELLTYTTLIALSMEDQFAALFPTLDEESWKEVLSKRTWDQQEMPYKLMVENTSGYSQDCHFCNTHQCKTNCPLPFSSKMTVLDMLHKVGVEDNVSFY